MRVSPAARKRARERRASRLSEPGRAEWKARHSGACEACGKHGPLVRHHVVSEQEVRRAKGDPWDQRNALSIGAPAVFGGRCFCHDGHHHPGVNDTRLPAAKLRPESVQFARELLGDDAAGLYLERHYR